MLVLSRKRHETIRIGEDVVVHVMKIGERAVSIGIEAPAEQKILRGELREWTEGKEEHDAA